MYKETSVPKSPYQLGIIGYGNIGKIHKESLEKSGQMDFQIRGIADPNVKPSAESIEFYNDARDLLKNSNIQVVSIATPPNTHYQLVMDALRAGKHVLVEKPPALTVRECKKMASLARRLNKVLFMAFHARYNPAVEAASKALNEKPIDSIHIQYREYAPNYHEIDGWIFNPAVAGGGALMDSGINALSIVTHILPNVSFSIRDTLFEKAIGFNVETKAQVGFAFNNTGEGMLSMDWMNKDSEVRQVTYNTTDGEYRIDIVKNEFSHNGTALLSIDPSRETVDQVSEYNGVYQDFAHHLAQNKSFISMRELAFIKEAYRTGKLKF